LTLIKKNTFDLNRGTIIADQEHPN